MAAPGGLNLPVGIELSQVEKDLQKLTSSVANVSEQLSKRLELKPTINTKAYEAAVDKMNDALMKLQTNFSKGFSYKVDNGKGFVDASFDSDSLFGSIDKMKASVAQLKGMLRNPDKYELNVGDAKELVGLQELIIKNWQTSTNEIHKQDAAVKSLIAKEVKLRNETKQRINDSIGRHERDRADAKNLNRRIDQIRAERVAIGKLISDYEQLAAKQRKFGESDAGTNRRIAALRKEHTQYMNLEREEQDRQKVINQNNALFNDQGRIIGKLKTLASRYISIFTIGTLARKVAETTGFFERQQVALEGIVGSVTKAAEIMGQIKSFAPNSPFQTKQLIEYTKQLAAYNISVDELFPKTKMLADLSAGLGVDMQRLILAYGQVNAASVLRGQELRQFTEAGIPMVQALADKFSELNGRIVTTGEVFELISKRQVSFEMVSQVLTDMTSAGGKFHNMQANLMGTVYGQIEKLKDLWTLSMDSIGKSSHKTITRVLSWMQSAVKNATSIFRGFVLTITINSLGQLWSRIKQLRTEIGLVGVAAKGAFGAISLGVGVAYSVFRKLWDENHRILKQFNEIHSAFQKQTSNAVKGLEELRDVFTTVDKGTKAYEEALSSLSSNYSQYIGDVDAFVESLGKENDMFDSLVLAIQKYNEALEKKQQLEQTRTTMGESFEMGGWTDDLKVFATPGNKHWSGIYGGFKERYKMSYDDANAAFEEVMSNIFTEMRDKNLLSVSDDRKVMNEENEKVFRELLPIFMKKGGLEKVFADFSQVGIDNLWSAFNSEAFLDNDSKRAYSEYRRLRREQMGYGSSDFAWISRIENTFKDLPRTLKTELQASTPEQYSREYNAKWIEAALGYIGNKNGDFAKLGKEDENGEFKQYAKAEYDKLIAVMRRETKRDQNGNLIGFDEASVYNVENAFKEYHKALAAVDKEGAAVLQHLMKIFSDGTDEASGRAAAVRETIFKIWANDAEGMKIARQYLPKDSDFSDIRGKLPQKQMDILTKLGEYGITLDPNVPVKKYKERNRSTHSAEANSDIDNLLKEYEVVTRLMEATQKGITISVQGPDGKPLEAQLFDISSREKNFTGGGGNNREFPDFFNIFKNAYDQYKRAAQQGGIANAINEFRSNPTLRSQYGDMFGIEGSIKEFGFKIGNKTVADIIKENLIEGGLEDGVVDFQKAAQKTAETLLAYGRANEKERGAFIRLGEQIQKWVTETFTKDAITTWLDAFGKSVQNLTVSFDNMRDNIELARKMSEQGTLGYFGGVAGIAGGVDITKPQSAVQRDYIAGLLSKYNSFSASTAVNGSMPDLFKLGDINSLSDIESTIKRLNGLLLDVNNEAFKAFPQGEAIVKELVNALKKLDKTVRDEVGKISGKSYTGNKLYDTVLNARISGNNADLVNQEAQRVAQANGLGVDQQATKARVEAAQKNASDVLSAYLEANNFDAMFAAYRKPIDIDKIKQGALQQTKDLPYLEQQAVLKKLDELERNVESFNAARGDFAPFFNGLTDYRTADSRAQAEWEKSRTDKAAIAAGATFNKEKNMFDKNNITDPETLAYIDMLNEKLDQVGMNGVKLAKVFKDQALNNIKAFCTTAQSSLDSMSDVVKNLVSSVQSVVKAFNKAYDVMNDGENPKWMQDTEAFLGDFAENFEAMIAPMSAVIALIIAITVAITVCEAVATPLLIVMAAVVAAAAILAAIIAAFQQHDRKLEHSIEGLKENVEAFDRDITNLQAAAERSVGFEKLRKNIAATGKELEKATAYAEMARLEEEKKNTDDDKVEEYKQSYQEAMDSFLNSMREVRNELVSSTEDWANAMGSAIRSAFQNGENAARAFRNTVKTMIGDVIENMLEMAILQPLIESALENWTNSDYLRQKYTKEWTEKDENGKEIKRSKLERDGYMNELLERIGNPELAEEFYQSMLMIGDTLIDTVNGMHPFLKDAYMHNSELGTLSGGIESVTEDTARRIEALENSQLGEVFAIRMMLQNYLEGSGFGDSMTADLQAAIVSIASDTNLIRIATESILARIDQMRSSNVQPLHVTIV